MTSTPWVRSGLEGEARKGCTRKGCRRRELVSRLVYRSHGLIFPREGAAGEPPHVRRVIGSPTKDVSQPETRNDEARDRLVRKEDQQRQQESIFNIAIIVQQTINIMQHLLYLCDVSNTRSAVIGP
ncbi:hypothetical protein Pmani_016064 [Petrolisthes manimaculis]|uniref:Uncharacterized protein n=1 Tax=Petrolisthes manimaculis TaxID=1843537 RepID=A0AAE1U959_9EUCA|nr:hypothetical protein Pmani_016064 [Petrolisthes manimaculis]